MNIAATKNNNFCLLFFRSVSSTDVEGDLKKLLLFLCGCREMYVKIISNHSYPTVNTTTTTTR